MSPELWAFLEKFAYACAPFGVALGVYIVKGLHRIDTRVTVLETKLKYHEQTMKDQIRQIAIFALLSVTLVSAVGCRNGKAVPPVAEQILIDPNTGSQVTNYVVAPEWKTPLETAQEVGNVLPPPFGTWLTLGATGILAILGARARTKQKTAEAVAETIIEGIEKIGTSSIKETISKQATVNGISKEVHQAVKKATK